MRDKILKYIEIKPVTVDGEPDAHHVFLQITNQRFAIGVYACETKGDAEWMRDQLAVALEKLVNDCADLGRK